LELKILLGLEFRFAQRRITMPVANQSAVLYREVGTGTVERKPPSDADLTIESA
jgi:hypothetical protein